MAICSRLLCSFALLVFGSGLLQAQVAKEIAAPYPFLAVNGVQATPGGYYVYGRYDYGLFVSRFSSEGILQWSGKYARTNVQQITSSSTPNSEGLCLLVSIAPDTLEFITLDENGSVEHAKKFSTGNNYPIWSSRIHQDNNGGYLIASVLPSPMQLIKTDAAGEIQWSFAITGDSTLYQNLMLDVVPRTGGGCYGSGVANGDLFVFCVDANGGLLWSRRFPESGQTSTNGKRIFELPNGNLLIAGGKREYYSPHRYGAFAAIMDPSGNLISYKDLYRTSEVYFYEALLLPDRILLFGSNLSDSGSYRLVLDHSLTLLDQEAYPGHNGFRSASLDANSFYYASRGDSSQNRVFRQALWEEVNCLDFSPTDTFTLSDDLFQSQSLSSANSHSLTTLVAMPATVSFVSAPEFTYSYLCGSAADELAIATSISSADDESFTVYPNPTAGMLTLQTGSWNHGTFTLTDLMGHEVMKGAFHSRETQLNLSSLPPGVYALQLQTENGKGSVTRRIAIQ